MVVEIQGPAKDVVLAIFLVGWCTLMGGGLFSLAENIGVRRLRPWAYRLGPVAVTINRRMHCPPLLETAGAGETDDVRYLVLEDRRCLFHRKVSYVPVPGETLLELKGELSWENGRIVATGRYPLGVLLALLGWLVCWTSGSAGFFAQGDLLLGVLCVLVGWLSTGAVILHSRWRERRRFPEVVHAAEVALWAGAGPGAQEPA
jgi:hypothetical protein